MPEETAKKNNVDMDREFHVMSLSRNGILDRFGQDDEDPESYYIKVKTLLENMSDNDVVNFIDEFCGFKHTFTVFTDNMIALVEERLEKGEKA